MNLVDVISSKIDMRTIRPPVLVEKFERNSKEYYEDKIERVRESKDEEVRQVVIRTKNIIKREFEDEIQKIKEKYLKIVAELKKEVVILKETLQSRDISINHLCNVVTEMNCYIVSTRILSSHTKFPKSKSSKTPKNEKLIEQIYCLNQQIVNLKDTCLMYQQDLDKINKSNDEFKVKLNKKELLLKNEIEKLSLALKAKDHECEVKVKKIQTEFDKYKRELNLEQAAREVFVDRQKQQINSLKDELKNAKIVLQSRKLREKFYERLDDYMKEVNPGHKKTKSEMPSRNASTKFRTGDVSRVTKKRTQKSELSSPNSRVFSRKISSPNCFTVDFTVTNSIFP